MLAAWGSKREEGKQPMRGMFSFFFFFCLHLWVPLVLAAACETFVASCWAHFLAVVHGLGHSEARGIILPQPGIAPMSPFHCKADS